MSAMLRRVVSMVWAAAAVALLAAGPTRAGNLYRCTAKDHTRIQDDGKLGSPRRERIIADVGSFFVDTDAGTLRRKHGGLETWTVIQQEAPTSDYVASPRPGSDSASTDFIRVRAWAGKPTVTFLWFALSELTTGTCELAR